MAPGPNPTQPAPLPSPYGADHEQWQQAFALAHTVPLPLREGQAQRARRDMAASAAVVLCLTATVLVLAYGRNQTGAASATSWTRLSLQLGLTVLGLALLVIGVVVVMRSGTWRVAARGPLSILDRPERRMVMRQLRGQLTVDTADHQRMVILRAVAAGLLRPWGYVLMICGSVTNVAAQAVGAPHRPVFFWTWVLCLVLFAAASVRLLRDKGCAERFLGRYLWSVDAADTDAARQRR